MEWICIGLVALAIYLLFIEGIFWKLIVLFFGWIGLYSYLERSFPASKATFMTIMGCHISWSILIPTVIVILAMATTRVKE